MKFKVDQDKCIGCGACANICNEIFEIDFDEGYAKAKDIEVPEDLKDDAQTAKESCPTGAIEEKEDNK